MLQYGKHQSHHASAIVFSGDIILQYDKQQIRYVTVG